MTKQQALPGKTTETAGAELRVGRPRDKRFDGYLKSVGFMLAVGSFVLPFVMYYDILDAQSTPMSSGKKVNDPLNRSNQKVVRETHGRNGASPGKPSAELDPMTTATTADLKEDRVASVDEASKQPFPGQPVFLLREIVGGLVMIEDDSGYWFVEKGATLPDGSKLVAIERGVGKDSWQIKTSEGDVISRTN
ncbi:hypothetical protein [Phyllobacterium bourgognense]|uniref:Uncharacterized protein n=1 Tax=Phyllobacterium bourgognense TaxID=314236 RepID=A0A368YSM9_9HYPH|nr:hypothetical protein [Phyllobacterium bourgognense]RCW82276.1 hypothetical protein C7476_10890 [Phyllobacterium bourgognense]